MARDPAERRDALTAEDSRLLVDMQKGAVIWLDRGLDGACQLQRRGEAVRAVNVGRLIGLRARGLIGTDDYVSAYHQTYRLTDAGRRKAAAICEEGA